LENSEDRKIHFEMLESVWEERYERQYGFWRPWIKNVIYRYLDCGDLHCGFARVKCKGCGHEYLPAFSCKRRHFRPSCHQKRVIEIGEWLCTDVLKSVPHRIWPVFEAIAHRVSGHTLIITHAGVIRVLICRILDMPLANLFSIGQAHGALNIIEVRQKNRRLFAMNLQYYSL
jgi:hypothetical protein